MCRPNVNHLEASFYFHATYKLSEFSQTSPLLHLASEAACMWWCLLCPEASVGHYLLIFLSVLKGWSPEALHLAKGAFRVSVERGRAPLPARNLSPSGEVLLSPPVIETASRKPQPLGHRTPRLHSFHSWRWRSMTHLTSRYPFQVMWWCLWRVIQRHREKA